MAKPSDAVTVGTKPTASTAAVASAGAGGGVLNGTVTPEDLSTACHFDYGTSTAYGSRVPASDAGVGSDTTGHAVSQSVSGLLADTIYYFRVVATNATGTTYGADQTLTTTAAVLSGLRVSPRKLSIAGRKGSWQVRQTSGKNDANKHCERLIKLKVRYTLNAASAVTFTLKVKSAGRGGHQQLRLEREARWPQALPAPTWSPQHPAQASRSGSRSRSSDEGQAVPDRDGPGPPAAPARP